MVFIIIINLLKLHISENGLLFLIIPRKSVAIHLVSPIDDNKWQLIHVDEREEEKKREKANSTKTKLKQKLHFMALAY